MNTLKAEHLKVAELSSLYEILQIIERWAAYLWFNSLSYISIPGFSTDSFWFTILKWDWITCIKFNIYIIFESQWHHQCDFLLTTLFFDIGCCFGDRWNKERKNFGWNISVCESEKKHSLFTISCPQTWYSMCQLIDKRQVDVQCMRKGGGSNFNAEILYNYEKCTAHWTVVKKKERTNLKFFFHFSFSVFVHIHPTARNLE